MVGVAAPPGKDLVRPGGGQLGMYQGDITDPPRRPGAIAVVALPAIANEPRAGGGKSEILIIHDEVNVRPRRGVRR